MKKLILGLALAFAANAAMAEEYYNVQIGDLWYNLDDATMTAEVTDPPFGEYSLKSVEIPASVTYEGQDYHVNSIGQVAFWNCSLLESVRAPFIRSIGQEAFSGCVSLKLVYAPLLTSIGQGAFSGCILLTSLTVNSALQSDWDSMLGYYEIEPYELTVTFNSTPMPKLTLEQVVQAGYEVKEAEFETTVSVTVVADPSVTLKSNEQEISEEDYAKACEFYGIEQKTKPDVPSTPTAEDFKVVSKDAQVVQEGEVAVKQTELQAAKAEAVSIADGVVLLGVTVNTNGNFTAETKSWAPVELKSENVKVENGKIVISIPVSDKSGFMILQSGDAKVPNAAVTHEPWYTPIE